MSHYLIGAGSSPSLQRYARQADRERSAAFKRALTLLGQALFIARLPRRA